ncbi:hypothetical protein AVEN_237395-1 [Araneus ventricosus]|uniref:Uncharacterized protein n=1 Tax=Araneus ventricosus TaxID=182803 RepID=A0A4Y2JXZ9_ARAVE|nr:hypothetical protein AVEN_237395-1 [Araneus ventricosus]
MKTSDRQPRKSYAQAAAEQKKEEKADKKVMEMKTEKVVDRTDLKDSLQALREVKMLLGLSHACIFYYAGRRIEVKIITAGYYDNEEGKDFHTLSDEETNQFQNMIMALLTGQQEAVQEMERQKKLEENYKFTWSDDKEEEKDD